MIREAQELVRDLEGDSAGRGPAGLRLPRPGGAQLEAGEAAAARESGLKALELAEALAARDPSASSRELLGTVFHRLTTLEKGPGAAAVLRPAVERDLRGPGRREPDKPYPKSRHRAELP